MGLWYVNYTSGGEPLYESFDQWHSDGTELENPNLAPATGPLCVGVWKQVGTRTFRLHHVGWNFDINGNSLGSFTLDETNTVSRNGLTYKGTFDLKFYDVDGNLVDEVTGTQTATRITVIDGSQAWQGIRGRRGPRFLTHPIMASHRFEATLFDTHDSDSLDSRTRPCSAEDQLSLGLWRRVGAFLLLPSFPPWN